MDELVGNSAWDKVHPDDIEGAKKLLADLAHEPEKTITTEVRYLRKDGEYRWIEITISNLLYDPEIEGFLGNYHDITERKFDEEALRSTQEMLLNSQSLANICSYSTNLVVTDINKSYWVCSPEFYKIFGIDETYPHTIEGWIGFLHPDYREEVAAYHESVVLEKKSFNREYKIIRINDGVERWVHGTGELVYDKNGKPVRMHGAIQDVTEQKQAELELIAKNEELHKTEEQASSSLQQIKIIQANTPNITWKWDIDKVENFKNCYISEGVDEFLALPKGSIGNSMPKFFSNILPEYLPLVDDAVKNAVNNPNKLISIEYEVKKADGKLAWFLSSGKVIPENNKLTIYGSTIDITEKKQNEQKLILSDTVFNLTLDMFCIAGFDGYFKYLNPAWERTLGWSVEVLLSKPWLDFVHPDDAENTENIKSVIVDGKEIYKFENRYICKDGSIKWLAWNSQPFPKENIMIGAARDITEAKKTENELVKAKEKAEEISGKLKAALESMSDAVFISDIEGNFIDFNDAFATFHKFKNKNEFARTLKEYPVFLDVFYPNGELLPIEMWVVPRALRGETNIGEEYVLKRKDTNETWPASYNYSPIRNNEGEIIGSIVTARDITSQKKYEKELLLAIEKAEESDRLKSAFLANMSHEIRTPMNGILGFTELLQDASLSVENHKEYIEIIKKSGDRLLNTVNDIIEISKIESGDINVTKSEVDLFKHLDTLVKFFRPEAGKKNIEIVVQNNIDGNDLTIATDKNKFDSILSNLIKNAIKYTNAGTIKVGFKIENDQILFTCQDTGIGIPKKRQEAIFNRFEQADIEDKHAHQGSGLGLAIVKSYVEMMDGKIWVESKENQGSAFYVSLPYEPEYKKKQIIPHDVKSTDSGIKNINVLVVEDDDFSLLHLLAVLEGMVKNIRTAENGIEAVEICKKDSSIDLVLMDIKMPQMDGFEATRQIRKFNQDVIIIAQTAFAFEEDKQKALDTGCNNYISKPIKNDLLFELIHKYF